MITNNKLIITEKLLTLDFIRGYENTFMWRNLFVAYH